MPNWCSNRMYFSGEPAQIAEIKRLASGAVTPLYRRATNEGIQLFLAGSAGLLQITENIRSEQCPGVTAAGRGAVSLENIAFTRWLTHLQNGVLLDEQNCLMLHELWLQSGTGQRRWEGLPDDVRETITVHFTAKRGDWCDIWGIRDVLLEDVAQRNIPLSHKKLRRALKAITRSESYLCAMKAGACRYDTEGYVTEHISQEEEVYAAARLDKIRRQNRIKAELQAVLDEK